MTLTIHYTDGPFNTPRESATITCLTQVMINSDKSLEFLGEVNTSDDPDSPDMLKFDGKILVTDYDSFLVMGI